MLIFVEVNLVEQMCMGIVTVICNDCGIGTRHSTLVVRFACTQLN